MSSAGHTRALQVAGAHHIAASASARPEAAEVPRRRPSERRKAPLPQGNFDPVFFLGTLTRHFGIGAILHSFLRHNPAHSSGQMGNHGPSATHTHQGQRMPVHAPHPIAHCTRAYRQRQHGEGDTRVRTQVRGTHARALAKRIATTSRASLASRVGSAPSLLRSAPQPLPSPLSLPALARPRRVRLRPRRCT